MATAAWPISKTWHWKTSSWCLNIKSNDEHRPENFPWSLCAVADMSRSRVSSPRCCRWSPEEGLLWVKALFFLSVQHLLGNPTSAWFLPMFWVWLRSFPKCINWLHLHREPCVSVFSFPKRLCWPFHDKHSCGITLRYSIVCNTFDWLQNGAFQNLSLHSWNSIKPPVSSIFPFKTK